MGIKVPKSKLEYLGTGMVYKSFSSSRAGVVHLTALLVVEGETVVICSCEGFSFNGKCWHADHVATGSV